MDNQAEKQHLTAAQWKHAQWKRGTTKAGLAMKARNRRKATWIAKWEGWKETMRGKYGESWEPIAGCDTWRKWRARRMIRLSPSCVAARKWRNVDDREFLRS